MSTNTIIIEQGRIGKDPELKYSKNDVALLTLSVCTSDSWRDKNNEWQNESNWMDVKFFGKPAEKAAEEALQGGEIYLRGHLRLETWESQGAKRSKLVVIPDMGHVHIYPPRPRGDQQQQSRQQQRKQNTNFNTSDFDGPPPFDEEINF